MCSSDLFEDEFPDTNEFQFPNVWWSVTWLVTEVHLNLSWFELMDLVIVKAGVISGKYRVPFQLEYEDFRRVLPEYLYSSTAC